MVHRDECSHVGSAGRISSNVEVKIVDIVTGEPLSVGQKGELRLRGPSIMKGEVSPRKSSCSAHAVPWVISVRLTLH
jgi:acyl-CoA synthetase (AMP-forming)/AMP-acid ligase II